MSTELTGANQPVRHEEEGDGKRLLLNAPATSARPPVAGGGSAPIAPQELDLRTKLRPGEAIIQGLLFLCGILSILTTVGIIVVLASQSWLFFTWPGMSLVEFFTGTVWQPQIGHFGILPLLTATLMTSTIAMMIALPLGLCVALYLSEYAQERVRSILKPVLELLAGIPTVVYGYFALTFITPLLRSIFGADTVQIYNMASAGIVIGILVLPLVASMSEDALRAVPMSLREASYGLGATKLESTLKVVLPAALSGISAAFIIAVSRAVGETMIVALAAGAGPNFTFNPFNSAETITGHIVRISGGDLSYDSIDYNSIFALGLVLFVMTLALNLLSRQIMRRFREEYQ
jgi:phosphate transport system permease protein